MEGMERKIESECEILKARATSGGRKFRFGARISEIVENLLRIFFFLLPIFFLL